MGKVLLILTFTAVRLVSLSAAPAVPQIEVVSRPYTNIAHVFGDSAGTLLSADGRWVLFSSSGNGLATNDNNGVKIDVFLKDLNSGVTTLISRNTNGASANGDSLPAGISADGKLILFESDASDLVADDDNDANDVFVYDHETGKTTRVSAGAEEDSGASIMTRNGRFVLFESASDTLSPFDTNSSPDLYLLDREAGTNTLVTFNSRNTASAASTDSGLGLFQATVSEDGRYVAFISSARDLVSPLVTAGIEPQLFLRDMVLRTNFWISRSATIAAGRNVSHPVLNGDGSQLSFLASKLLTTPNVVWLHFYSTLSRTLSEVPAPPGAVTAAQDFESFSQSADGSVIGYALNRQIYLYTVADGLTRRISGGTNTISASTPSSNGNPVISESGKMVLFESADTNLVETPITGTSQLYSFNVETGALALLTPNYSRTAGANYDILFPALSGDGSRAGFTSYATDLVSSDDKHANDVFVVSTSGQEAPVLLSVALPSSLSATGDALSDVKPGAISADGNWVAFTSSASDLVPNDENSESDVFLRDLRTGETRLVSVSPDGIHPFTSPSLFLAMSSDGRRVAFTTTSNVTSTSARNILVYDRMTGTNMVANVLPTGGTVAANEGNLSADGKYLAFWPGGSVNETYVRDLETGETKQASNIRPQVFEGISPGGKYVRIYANGLVMVDWQTGKTLQLGGPGDSGAPMPWDDSSVLFYKPGTGPGAISSAYLYSFTQNRSNLVSTNAGFVAISGDGKVIAYLKREASSAQNLYTYEISTGLSTLVDFPNPDPLFRLKSGLVLSEDGRYLAFTTTSPIIGTNNASGFNQVYLYDRLSKGLTLVSQGKDGTPGNFGSGDPSLSGDGQMVVFQSSASNLVPNDLNVVSDVFLARVPSSSTADADSDGLDDGWEITHFGNLNAGPADDPDTDGLTNLEEFLAGTDPKSANFLIQPVTITTEGKLHVTWNTAPGKSYQLQFRESLGTGAWTNIGEARSSAGNTLSSDISLQGSASGFFRIQMAQ